MISNDFITAKENGARQTLNLRRALLGEQFMIYYQPVVDAKTYKVVSAEALIRWDHPELGIVTPSHFIKLAEETGLIIPIGKWVIRQICGQFVLWREKGIPLIPISINIGAQQLSQQDFTHEVRELLDYYQLDGSLLAFEISETSLMKNEHFIIESLEELKELGIKVYIDHFGNGHSSLSYLNSFRLDGIKIDRSFIHDISWKPENAVITSALIEIGHNLHINVIAEGIETVEELQYLQELNCNQLQGYLFGRPCSVQDFELVLKKGQISPIQKEMINDEKNTYRIPVNTPFQAEIILIDYLDRKEKDEETNVLIENIGPGGLRIQSNLKLIVGQEMIYSFKPEKLKEDVQVAGVVLWNDELPNDQFQYGIHFIIPDHQRTHLTQLLR
ncbi:EAL domain-containing protein [Mesobacillus maritimus]|uniref:EAL domain-containing protein n=1 Tax=Mesobacillus maritimus TaxID=1643336 RepID=UPI00384BCF62